MAKTPLADRPRAFLDIETTGLDPQYHDLIEIAFFIEYQKERDNAPLLEHELDLLAKKGRGGLVLGSDTLEFHCRLMPAHIERAQPKALDVNGYTKEKWEGTPEINSDIARVINRALYGCVIIGHNPKFDVSFIQTMSRRVGVNPQLGYHAIDTVTLAWEHLAPCGLERLSLSSVCEFLGISNEGAHTALADVHRCREVYKMLCRATKEDRGSWGKKS